MKKVFRYEFTDAVDMADIEASLLLAIVSCESQHGESQVRLDASHAVDPIGRVFVIDATTEVGADLNRFFTGFLLREFGESSFCVRQVDTSQGQEADKVSP